MQAVFADPDGGFRKMDKHDDQLTPELDYAAIGRRIRGARKRLNMTQEKLAELTGLSVPHLSNIENGKTKLSLPALVKIANALESSLDALVHDSLKVTQEAFDKDFKDLLEDCSMKEKGFIYNLAKEAKNGLRK